MNEGFPQSHPEELPPEQHQVEQPTFDVPDTLDGHLSIATPQRIEVSDALPPQETENVHIIERDNDLPENNEQPTDTVEQETPVETGLMSMEREKTLEKADIDDLQQKSGELSGIYDVQSGLEVGIIGSGLQVMADRYGADKLLAALQTRGVTTFQGVIEQLASEKTERKALYDAIKAEPMNALAERFDQTLGGVVANGVSTVSGLERFRKFEMFSIENKRVMKDVDGNRVWRGRDTDGYTDSAGLLLTGDFDSLLKNNPDLVQQFREDNNTLGLLKGIREIYEAKYTDFATNLEAAKATVETKVTEGEASIVELQTISDDIYYDEIAKLEERLAGVGSDAARDMVQDMLDKKTADFMVTHEDFKGKMEAVRTKIVAELGADRLNQLRVATPVTKENITPTYNDKEKYAA